MRHVLGVCLALAFALLTAGASAQYGGGAGPVPRSVGVSAGASAPLYGGGAGAIPPGAGVSAGAVPPGAGAVPPGVSAGAVPPGVSAGAVPPGAGVSPGAYPAGADQQAEQYYYLYQSLLYGLQGGGGGYVTPEIQAQVARSVQQYFTNGAAMTAVPTTGAAATYFTNGAQATAASTSAMPDYAFSPPLAAPPSLGVDAGAPARAVVAPVEAGAAQAEAPATAPTGTEVAVEPQYAAEPAYPEGAETTAPATPRVPASPTAVPAPTTTPPAPAAPPPNCTLDAYGRCIAEAAPAPALSPAPAPHVSPSTLLWPMLGGIAIGALLVLLGTRIRPRSASST